ncbi:hypothetical protein DPMN_089632 [Dreissena polymorpha]|uniref:Uncharacterized protein n=1 Tax=Dreissena polymorpha TaxID=45954 RepID=A0A9D4KWB3_DREPO|nr:hypothetical protein DPMN_089632 [Dreissena polymorpha]
MVMPTLPAPELNRALPETTGAPPGHDRRRLGLNRVVAVSLPGLNAGIAPVSTGVGTVYRGFVCVRAFTGAQPGHYRRQPGLCRGFTGINSTQSGVDLDSAGLLTGFNRGCTGK